MLIILIFAVSNQVLYNLAMIIMTQKFCIRVFLYLLLFIISFLVFDSVTVVATVLFAMAALDHFLYKSEKKKGL